MSVDYQDLNSYDYFLPKELIAQAPLEKRSDSRLLHYSLKQKKITDNQFQNITDYFDERDVLVFNETKVRNARIIGNKFNFLHPSHNIDNTFLFSKENKNTPEVQKEKGAEIELLILNPIKDSWKAIAKPAKRLQDKSIILLRESIFIKIISREKNIFILEFYKQKSHQSNNETSNNTPINTKLSSEEVENILESQGQIPLPPYIQSPYEATIEKMNIETHKKIAHLSQTISILIWSKLWLLRSSYCVSSF